MNFAPDALRLRSHLSPPEVVPARLIRRLTSRAIKPGDDPPPAAVAYATAVTEPPTAPVAAGSLVLGYVVARNSGVRPLGGVVLVAAGAWCARAWVRRTGPGTASALVVIYTAGFAGSHPLAKRIGAWPAVLASAAVSGVASWVLADRARAR